MLETNMQFEDYGGEGARKIKALEAIRQFGGHKGGRGSW